MNREVEFLFHYGSLCVANYCLCRKSVIRHTQDWVQAISQNRYS